MQSLTLQAIFIIIIEQMNSAFFMPSNTFGATVKKLWLKFALFVGKINTVVILTLIFILILTPTGFLLRLVRKSPLERRQGSIWEDKRTQVDLDREF